MAKAKQVKARFASAIPTSRQLQKARSEGWAKWIITPQDEAAVAQGCWFDLERAESVRTYFCERFSHGKDRFYDQPFIISADNWLYRDVIAPIYGWRTPEGYRRCRSCYVEVPKKNGKTQVAAGISLIEMRWVTGSRVYIVATSRGQATECFDEAAGMVERRSWLKRFYKVLRSTGKILYPAKNSAIEVLPKNAAGSEGKNASALILDELHAWTDRALFDSLLFAGAARANPLLFMITTAGKDLSSLCYSEHERAERQKKGLDLAIDHHSVVYAADRGARWDDIDQWKKGQSKLWRDDDRAIGQIRHRERARSPGTHRSAQTLPPEHLDQRERHLVGPGCVGGLSKDHARGFAGRGVRWTGHGKNQRLRRVCLAAARLEGLAIVPSSVCARG